MGKKRARQTQRKAANEGKAANATGWCPLSEQRLLEKIILYKPVGLNAQFNIIFLHYWVNNIEDSEDTNFEDYLSEKDFETLKRRRQEGKIDPRNPIIFQPRYAIRPTAKQIVEKLGDYYNLELCGENLPKALEKLQDLNIDFSNIAH